MQTEGHESLVMVVCVEDRQNIATLPHRRLGKTEFKRLAELIYRYRRA